MNKARDDQSTQAGKCRCAEEIDHGCSCDLTGSTCISDGTDSNDNGAEDHRKDHHVQGVHVDTSDQAGYSEDGFKPSGQEKGTPFLNLIDSVNEVCLKIITTIMYFTPIGVFCTIVPVVEANGTETIISLATQLVILYVAFFGFAIVVYGLSVKLIGKQSPLKFLKAILPAALNAFGTCSSSATIPLSKQCMEEEMGVSNQITSIAIPLGATVNMDAVSILMSFMIMFFANACGIHVSIPLMIIILLANVLLSVGTPGVPGGAIASFAALATMAGLPAGVLGVYISINTLCDMGATCVNVIGDMACCSALKNVIKIEEEA